MQIIDKIRSFFSPKPKVVNLEPDETVKALRATAKHLASSLNEAEVTEAKELFESLLFMPISTQSQDIPSILNEMNVSTLKGAISILMDISIPPSVVRTRVSRGMYLCRE